MIKKKRAFGIQTIIICMSSTLVLVVLGTMLFLLLSGHQLSDYVKQKLSLSLVIKEGVSDNDVEDLQKRLSNKPYIAQLSFVSKEEILEEQKKQLGSDPSEFLGYNPYNSTLNVNLEPDYTHPDSIAKIKTALLKEKAVEDVSYQKELIEVVNENLRKVNLVLLVFALLMFVISYSLINSMVKLTIFSKRFLLHTMKLVGASWNFIRKPFLVQAFWMGAVSGLSACLVLLGIYYMLVSREPGLAGFVPPLMFGEVLAAVLFFGILIVVLSVFISLNKYLRLKANELFYI